MKKTSTRRIVALFTVILLAISMLITVVAHSGRTDSSGGHKDNKNKSGLGSYHYHCGGYPAHKHSNGYCPYTDVFPSRVNISVDKTTLGIGEQVNITGSVYPANSCNTKITWECSDSSVILLSGNTIKAVGYGTATIKATSFNGKVGSVKITVKEITAEKVSITASIDEKETVYIGDTLQLSATITPTNVDNPTITWSSSSPEVATVSNNGKVTTIAAGTTTIKATAKNGVSGKYVLTVKEKFVESVTISEETVSMILGASQAITAEIFPSDATRPEITWTSSNPSVVEVADNGTMRAFACGEATITATATNGKKDSVAVVVSEIVAEKIEIQGNATIVVGEQEQLSVAYYPEDTTVKRIEWSVNDESIANISDNGLFAAKGIGVVEVTAKQKDAETVFQISIMPKPVEQIEITSSLGFRLHKGDIAVVSATIFPHDATYASIEWESSNPEIVTIDKNGNIEAKALGKAMITAKTEDGYIEEVEVQVAISDGATTAIVGGAAALALGGAAVARKKKKK